MTYSGPLPNPGSTTMLPRALLNFFKIFGCRCLACGAKDQPLRNNGSGLFCRKCWAGGWGGSASFVQVDS